MKNIIILILAIGLFAACATDKNPAGDILMEADKIVQPTSSSDSERIIMENAEPKLGKSSIQYTGEINIDVNNPEAHLKNKALEEPKPQLGK